MSEKDQGILIGSMAEMPETDQKFLLGVMAGLAAKQAKTESIEAESNEPKQTHDDKKE